MLVLDDQFADWYGPFIFVADVDDDVGFGDLEDGAFDDLAFRHIPKAVVINAEHGRKLLRIHTLVMHRFYSWARSLASPCTAAYRCSGLLTHFLGCDQPVFYVRHSARVLLAF